MTSLNSRRELNDNVILRPYIAFV